MMKDYKLAKEAFVSNLNGGTIQEINLVTLTAPVSVLLWSILQANLSLFTPYTPLSCLIDVLINCIAILFAITLYSSNTVALNVSLLVPVIVILFVRPSHRARRAHIRKEVEVQETSSYKENPFPSKPFVTTYRGTMMAITCAAILAVDFNVFPRRFAKVENWGTSLMDIGVGSFVFSAGVVAARQTVKQKSTAVKPLIARLRTAFRHSLPLLVLGLIRLYSVKELDYAEHVSEYGVHWNFFFTLSVIPPFAALFDSAFRILPSYGLFSMVVGLTYEILLNSTDLKAYILSAPRVDLISQNREGIFSAFGYLAIFLAGQGTGTFVLPRSPPRASLFKNPVFRKLTTWSCLWCVLFYLSTSYTYGFNLQVSRRLANLPYVLWIAAFNCCQITLFFLIETLTFPRLYEAQNKEDEARRAGNACSPVLHALNRNGLAVFLVANLLTGLVNLTLPTLHMSSMQAMMVLVSYMAVLAGMALILDKKGLSVKL